MAGIYITVNIFYVVCTIATLPVSVSRLFSLYIQTHLAVTGKESAFSKKSGSTSLQRSFSNRWRGYAAYIADLSYLRSSGLLVYTLTLKHRSLKYGVSVDKKKQELIIMHRDLSPAAHPGNFKRNQL